MTTDNEPMDEWKTISWKRHERAVFKLQKRIYRASTRGDVKTVHKLQRLLVRSRSAKLIAVRRVTQDNRGKRTAGIDGVKALSPSQRLHLAATLTLRDTAAPTRRVWIPKPGTSEQRPLGIPTMRDRAAQALAALALEPEWEARFEPNSYGFRPGRSAHDAIEAIWLGINRKPKYVLDADIAKCFDRVDHQALLGKLRTIAILRRAIRAWLKAGVMDGRELFPTDTGTPQGGVISPLLANVALHGLETSLQAAFPRTHRVNGKVRDNWKPLVIRYADDFVILHEDRAFIERAQQSAEQWLATMGLQLKPSKTQIVHTLVSHEGRKPGFDFLGFTVRQFRVGRTHSGKSGGHHPTLLGFKSLTRPSQEAQHRHSRKLGEIVRRHRMATQEELIKQLNLAIRGWTQYYSAAASKEIFSKMAHQTYVKLHRWATRRHQKKSWAWIAKKYWRREQGTWTFAPKGGVPLYNHAATPIRRHIKVQGIKSPYDGDWVYWTTRLGRHPELPPRVARLLKRQKGRCAWCGLFFRDGDLPEVDHIVPTSRGGKNVYDNWQLLHGHCHDAKTATDGSNRRRSSEVPVSRAKITGAWEPKGIPKQPTNTVEEPDEGKLSRPVL